MAHSMSLSHSGHATDLESEARLASTEELLRELIASGQKIMVAQLTIMLRSENRRTLDSMVNATLSHLRELNSTEGLAESLSSFKAWKTMLPFGHSTMIRSKRIKTDNLADFMPVYSGFQGMIGAKPVCLFRNRQSGLVTFDPYDASLPNYNCLVTGSSGAGKSFLNNLVLLQFMTQAPKVFVIDIGGSYRKLCEYFGGQYVDIAPARDNYEAPVINPFSLPNGTTSPSAQKIKFLLAFLEAIIVDESCDAMPRLERALMEEAIIRVYTEERNCGMPPTLSDFCRLLAEAPEASLRGFAKVLYPWTGDRSYGRLLDGQNTFSIDADLVVFDFKGLASYPDLQAVMVLIVTDYILGKIENTSNADQGCRKQILMDEAWELLKSRASSSFMEYCVRTLRKTGSGITFITQGLEEIIASPVGPAILSNTATKFIMMQRGDLGPVQRILKLNEQESALVHSLRQVKGEYSEAFLIANDLRGVVRLVPSPIEYWLASSDASENAYIEEQRQANPGASLVDIVADIASRYPHGLMGGRV